jgi:eukaryotic-like serine/threonine-protein kinase
MREATATVGRFERRRRLGAGAFGEVWEAYDRQRGELVALKSLTRADPESIYRFKQEFRALADIRHPNLVTLHELLNEGDEWLLVMELVHGVDFTSYIRPDASIPGDDTLRGDSRPSDIRLARTEPASSSPVSLPSDLGRLRTALVGLVGGVVALHDHGKLHRDLKPSNVIVTPEGRVVLLDFGLVVEARANAPRATATGTIVGTPAYMAPEQLAGTCAPASDAYAVGVMLFEAVTGVLPFDGSPLALLGKKQSGDGPPPSAMVIGVPDDLDLAIAALLRLDPARRPLLKDVLQKLVPETESSSVSLTPELFFGREAELRALDCALDSVQQGAARTLFVRGLAGMGKTSVVRTFLETRARPRDALVLDGRCYEHESVPYKALDGIVDKLSAYLRGLRADVLQDALSSQLGQVARLFPVLRGVAGIAAANVEAEETLDPREVRSRAFAALREVLQFLSQHRPLVIFVDAMQWGDVDSVPFFLEVLRPPDAPRALLLIAYRTEEEDRSDALRLLRRQKTYPFRLQDADIDTLDVAPLSLETTSRVATALLAESSETERIASTLARECGGSPLLLQELVRHAREEHDATSPGSTRHLGLQEMLAFRTDRLPLPCRHLLEIVCTAGFPLRVAVALRAAGIQPPGKREIRTLCDRRLLRVRTARGEELIEPLHDRIRETVVGNLGKAEAAAWHRSIASALEHFGEEGERLAMELHLGGHPERARAHLVLAADRASGALAFQRAAALYQLALTSGKSTPEDRSLLNERMGNALVECGRGRDAALAYRRAVKSHHDAADALRLRRQAAEQFLRSGHVGDGLTSLRDVLRTFRMWFPPAPIFLVLALMVTRAQLWLRGIRFRARPMNEINPAALARVDAAFTAAMGLSMIDPIAATYFQGRALLLALSTGEASRIGRALTLEAIFSAFDGRKAGRRTRRLHQTISRVTETSHDALLMSWALASKGVSAYFEARFARSTQILVDAERFTREHVSSEVWGLGNAQVFLVWALAYRGEWAEVLKRLPDYVREAEERGDRLAGANLRMAMSAIAWIVRDDPEGARREIDAAMASWPRDRFCVQHWYELTAQTYVDLYRGDAEPAFERLERALGPLSRSLLLGVELLRIELAYAHARAALALAEACPGRSTEMMGTAAKMARAMEREKSDMGHAFAGLVRAALAAREGRTEDAMRRLGEAEAGFDALCMEDHAMAARTRRGELLGSGRGATLIEEAERSFRYRGILAPARFVQMLAPGFGRSPA